MLLLEFLCGKSSSDLVNKPTEDTYLVGVLLNYETECVAFDLATRELWSRGFVVLQVRSVSRCRQRDCRASDLLSGLWDQAELAGISVLVTESSVRFSGSKIRGSSVGECGARANGGEYSKKENTVFTS